VTIKQITPSDLAVALRAETLQLRKQLKDAELTRSIFALLAEEISACCFPIAPLEPVVTKRSKKGLIAETLVLVLSDEHADLTVKPEAVGGLERFSFDVACCRAELLIETIIDYILHINHKFDRIVVFALGDHVSGEIHGGTKHTVYQNAIKNALAVGQLHGLMLTELARHFEVVDYIGLSGNHGRRSVKKSYHEPHDNWDYLVHKTAEAHCRGNSRIAIVTPEAFSVTFDIDGHAFGLAHGDDIRSWMGIPFYGIERRNRRLTSLMAANGRTVNYFIFGHFHSLSSMADLKGEVIINGAFPATDPYVFNAFSGWREPMQLLFAVHKKYGVTWRLPVKIRDPEREKVGPTRYKVVVQASDFVPEE
jgi:hypothetical protein